MKTICQVIAYNQFDCVLSLIIKDEKHIYTYFSY